MGFFDNLKKKKEAKALGLSVDQYDQFLIAKTEGITLNSFKRYISSFAGKYSLDQYAQYLELEDKGYSVAQCERYFSELSGRVAVADYADFLAAEQLGLTVSEYATYVASLKGAMSAVDYVGFLKAQKLGLTMGKYLRYLKSFKGEMTVEEYDIYLKAEENGMDHERYVEYLQKYKEQYTIERYLEFDKARALGMTLEEYDLRIEASRAGMSLEKYRNHLAATNMGLSAEEYAVYMDILGADCIHDGIFVIPSQYTTLPKNVFKHLSFNSVVFPEGITEITDSAFSGCAKLNDISFPATVQTIGDESFEDCVSLVSVTIPGTVKKVDYHAFKGCVNLRTLQFEEGVEDIDISDWAELPALNNVTTPATALLQHLPPFRERDVRYGIINKDMRLRISDEIKVDCIGPARYGDFGILEHQSEIEYLEVYGDFVFLELVDFPNLKTVIFSAKGHIESIRNCPSLQMIYYQNYLEEITPETILVYKGLRPARAVLSLRNYDAPQLHFLAVANGAKTIDFAHYSENAFVWIHLPPVVEEVEEIVADEERAIEDISSISPSEIYKKVEVEEKVPANKEIEEITHEIQNTAITFANHLIIDIPEGYVYSTDYSVIGMNRALVAIQDDTTANFQDPYSATKSITLLNGRLIQGLREADGIAESIGLADARILVADEDLNIRYSVKESTDELTIILALICTNTRFFPAQFFFNGTTDTEIEAAVRNMLLTIRPVEPSVDIVAEQSILAEMVKSTPVEPIKPVSVSEYVEKKPYSPGKEPEKLRGRIKLFFEKLSIAYPEKVIVGLDKDHKHWAETAVVLYRELGYENRSDFFAAYGYTVGVSENKGGRPKKDHMAIVDELKKRYSEGPSCATVEEIKLNNPDLAPRMKNLQNQAKAFFGMPLREYFIQEGILIGKPESSASPEESFDAEFVKLKSRFEQAPYVGTLGELRMDNPDIEWSMISKYYARCQMPGNLNEFFVTEGILINQEELARTRLRELMDALKKRYPADKPFSGTLEKLKADNGDLPIGDMNNWTRLVYNLSTSEYLTQQGVLTTAKSIEDKLKEVTEILKERYASREKKAYTLTDLREQNLDLPISTIGTWSKKVYGQNATEYLRTQGILSEYDWMDSMRLEQ